MTASRFTHRRLPRRAMNRLLVTASATWAAASTGLTLISPALAAAWEKIDEAHGIQVFRKEEPGSKLYAFRGTGIVDAPMEKVIWVLADNTHRTEWVDRLKKSVVLEKKGDYEFILYQHFGSPPTVSDRDFVYRAKAYSKKDGSAVLDITSVTHKSAPSTVGVRGELKYSSYVLKRVGAHQTHVDVSVSLDPKGALPGWIVNLVQKSWPMNTLKALRQHVKKPFVGSLPPPPIDE